MCTACLMGFKLYIMYILYIILYYYNIDYTVDYTVDAVFTPNYVFARPICI